MGQRNGWDTKAMKLTDHDLRVLWDAWAKYAPPDMQVALDAAKERGEPCATLDWPPYIKCVGLPPTDHARCWAWNLRSVVSVHHSNTAYFVNTNPISASSAEYYCQRAAIPPGYSTWQDVLTGNQITSTFGLRGGTFMADPMPPIPMPLSNFGRIKIGARNR